jgi:hypothetical protein
MDTPIEIMPDRIGELSVQLDQMRALLQAQNRVINALSMRVLALEQELRAFAHASRGAGRST